MHVADATGVALDRRARIDAGVGEVTGVDAQIDIHVVHEPLDLVLELDVAPGVRVDDRTQPMTAGNVADLLDLIEHRAPSIVVESRRDRGSAGRANAHVVGSIDDHEHPSTRRCDRQARRVRRA